MKKTFYYLGSAIAGLCLCSIQGAQAQFFNYSTVFLPNPVTTSVAGNQFNVTNGSNASGIFAGSFGSDIVATNFAAVASSATTGNFNGPVSLQLTLRPTDSLGNILPGDSPVTHTFNFNLNILALDSSQVVSSVTGLPTLPFNYNFADGTVFAVNLTGYVGPSAPNGVGSGSLGGHVNGALAGIPQNLPEPGSLALLIGVAGCGFFARAKRRIRK